MLDNKYYIGMHKTNNLDDSYMGSGKLLKRAIKKHGLENFIKEILFVFDNEQEMLDKEKELVVLSTESYNLCEGGKGGFGFINQNKINGSLKGVEKRLELMNDPIWKEQFDKKRNQGQKKIDRKAAALKGEETKRKNGFDNKTFLGKTHSEEARRKISLAHKGKIPWNKGLKKEVKS